MLCRSEENFTTVHVILITGVQLFGHVLLKCQVKPPVQAVVRELAPLTKLARSTGAKANYPDRLWEVDHILPDALNLEARFLARTQRLLWTLQWTQ